MDPSPTSPNSRSRLIEAGKELFARNGYAQTSTSVIARRAGTSESQLVRYFRGKAGLLEAIFDECFEPLNQSLQAVIAEAASAHDAVLAVTEKVVAFFDDDPDLAFLCLFEGRRIHLGQSEMPLQAEMALPKSFMQFGDLLRLIARRGRKDGTFGGGFRDSSLALALTGAAEAMIRQRVIAHRSGEEERYPRSEIVDLIAAMLSGLSAAAPVSRAVQQ